jgi:hypothetical protein
MLTLSGGTIALGLAVLFDGRSVGGLYTPLLLLALGIGMLASGLVHFTVPADPYAVSTNGVAQDSLKPGTSCPTSSTRELELGLPEDSVGRRMPATHGARVLARSSTGNHATAGDFLWESWAPSVGSLPVELVGPASETAYLVPKPRAPVPYEEREPVILEPPAPEEPVEWSSPTGLEGPVLLTCPSLTSSEIAETASDETPFDPPSQDSGLVGQSSIVVETTVTAPVLHEALEPTPPHLRRTGKGAKALAPDPPRKHHASGQTSRCANCRTTIHDPKSWRRCPDCHHQLCTPCIVEALLTYEGGWCTHCAGLRHFEALSAELEMRPSPRIPGSAREVDVSSVSGAAHQFEIDVPHYG